MRYFAEIPYCLTNSFFDYLNNNGYRVICVQYGFNEKCDRFIFEKKVEK